MARIREAPWNRRKALFKQGLMWAAFPVVFFIPTVGMLTVCPPTNAEIELRVVLTVFAVSEIWGLWKLVRAVDWKPGPKTDMLDVLTLPVITLGAIVLAVCLYWLLAGVFTHVGWSRGDPKIGIL